MSQPDSSVPNGIPPYKWDGGKYILNNGVGSSQSSSRDSSPIQRFSNVPISQLPPSRMQIPTSQLPPGRSIKSVNTPQGSPYIPNYTSTPKDFNILTGNLNNVPHSENNRHHGNLLTSQDQDDIKQPMFVPITQDQPPSLQPSEQINLTKQSIQRGFPSAFTPVKNQRNNNNINNDKPMMTSRQIETLFDQPHKTNLIRAPAIINSGINKQFESPDQVSINQGQSAMNRQSTPDNQNQSVNNQIQPDMKPSDIKTTMTQPQSVANQELPISTNQDHSVMNQWISTPQNNHENQPNNQETTQNLDNPTLLKNPISRQTPPMNHGAPPMSQGAPPMSHGAPPMSQGAPPMSHGAPPMSHGAPLTNLGTQESHSSQNPSPTNQVLHSIQGLGPGMSQGSPIITQGAPAMSQGASAMSQGPPSMSQAPPLMSNVRPPTSNVRPSMNQGVPSATQIRPPMNQASPMNQAPPVHQPPSMSQPHPMNQPSLISQPPSMIQTISMNQPPAISQAPSMNRIPPLSNQGVGPVSAPSLGQFPPPGQIPPSNQGSIQSTKIPTNHNQPMTCQAPPPIQQGQPFSPPMHQGQPLPPPTQGPPPQNQPLSPPNQPPLPPSNTAPPPKVGAPPTHQFVAQKSNLHPTSQYFSALPQKSITTSANQFAPPPNQPSGSQNQSSGPQNQFSGPQHPIMGTQSLFGQKNQFSGQSNQFSGQPNQFSGQQNQFSGQQNQFSGQQNQFSGQQNLNDSSRFRTTNQNQYGMQYPPPQVPPTSQSIGVAPYSGGGSLPPMSQPLQSNQSQPIPPMSQYKPTVSSAQNSPRLLNPTATLPADVNTVQSPMFGTPKSEYSSPQPYPITPTMSGKRYPQSQKYPAQQQTTPTATYGQYRQSAQNQGYQQMSQGMANMNLQQTGFNRMWGTDNFDLLQCPNILPPEKIEVPKVCLGQEYLNNANCSQEIFRCTMTKIPENSALLQKSRLPLGVLIHPFRDLNHLPVIQCSTIVRCRACRTYINPYVFFVDTKRWKCNLCYRVNELPEEFQYDPVSKSYGDPSRRPEIKSSTIEYIAPSEYMLRPPQPAVYLFLLDISRLAIESGYLHTVCEVLSSQLVNLPGDSRTQIGFLAYNSTLHFFSLGEGLSQPHEMTVVDIDDVFLPCPDNLLVNLKERMELVTDLLALLPKRYVNSFDNGSALGAALQAAFKMMAATGGRVTVFQAALPTLGPGALTIREDPNQRAGKEAPHLNPATDFYKRLALECSGHQVAVDLFLINSQYVDIATLSGISRFSGGCMHHFPLFKSSKTIHAESLERCFKRYLTRKIGFEAVMRIRCTRGLAVHTFHGNFFVRSTDLLSLPNVNPDAGFGMQVSIEESLSDLQTVCFQAALLYTSSKGERRIRVHTLCLPVVSTLTDVLNSADQQCIVGMLAKMAVDRSMQSSLSDARDAFINVAIDILQSYKFSLNMGDAGSGLLASHCLKLLPLYILALLKHIAFRSGHSTRLDDRVFAMCEMKTLPLYLLIQQVYPDLYPIHNLTDEGGITDADGIIIPQPPRLQLTARNIDSHGVYLLDCGQQIVIYVCQNTSMMFLSHVLGVPSYNSISDHFYELPKIENPDNQRLHTFINSLNEEKPYCASLHIIRENSPNRTIFLERLIEDRIESALSYNEFLQHIKTQVK